MGKMIKKEKRLSVHFSARTKKLLNISLAIYTKFPCLLTLPFTLDYEGSMKIFMDDGSTYISSMASFVGQLQNIVIIMAKYTN